MGRSLLYHGGSRFLGASLAGGVSRPRGSWILSWRTWSLSRGRAKTTRPLGRRYPAPMRPSVISAEQTLSLTAIPMSCLELGRGTAYAGGDGRRETIASDGFARGDSLGRLSASAIARAIRPKGVVPAICESKHAFPRRREHTLKGPQTTAGRDTMDARCQVLLRAILLLLSAAVLVATSAGAVMAQAVVVPTTVRTRIWR